MPIIFYKISRKNRSFFKKTVIFLACLFFQDSISLWALRLATWNVKDYGLSNRTVEGKFYPDYPKTEKEKSALRSIIRSTNPDVITLQEIGGDAFLHELQEDLLAEGSHYPYRQCLEAHDCVRKLGILSKLPFKSICSAQNLSYTFQNDNSFPVLRGLLGIELTDEGTPLRIYTLHLKSRIESKNQGPTSAQKRRLEALTLRDLILKQNPLHTKPSFIIMGDFNDAPRSPALQLFQKKGDKQICKALLATDSRGEIWTHYYPQEAIYSRIDYILASEALFEKSKRLSAHIADEINCLEASDHRLVYVDIDKNVIE